MPGRKSLGKGESVTFSFVMPPSMLDAVSLIVAQGPYGQKSTVLRAFVTAGLDQVDDLMAFARAPERTSDDGEGTPRKPGPGPKRIGRERMVTATVILKGEVAASIVSAAQEAGIPKGNLVRQLAQLGFQQTILAGYKTLPEVKKRLRKQKKRQG